MIHCFSIESRNLVLDVESGALHQVDNAALNVLKAMQNACEDDITSSQAFLNALPEIQAEIRTLVDGGKLFSPPRHSNLHEHMKNRSPVVKALCLHMAHECNLSCAYCFAGDGNYLPGTTHGRGESGQTIGIDTQADTQAHGGHDRGLMPLEVGKKALDFLIAESGERRNLEVDFFGGEPMLNFDTVKELVAYGRAIEAKAGKKFRFTLTTNGALLTDENMQYINQHMDNVVVSLDGRPHVNDRMRKCRDGSGSYTQIYPKIKKLADSRENYYVRGTFTRHNTDFAADVLHLADSGFGNISVEPVVAPSDVEYSLREEDLPTLFAEYEKLADALLTREAEGRGVLFFHFEMNLDGGPCIAKRVTGCGAGSEYLAVTPSGRLYPCHQFVGDESFQIGHLDTGIKHNAATNDFAVCHVYAKPECANCWARYHCSGGCMATAYYANDSILKPDKISCELMRKRIECALYIFAERLKR